MINHPLHTIQALFQSSTSSSFLFSPHVESRLMVSMQGFRGNRRRSAILFYCAHVHDVVLVASAAYIFMQIAVALFGVDGLLCFSAQQGATRSANVLISFAVKLAISAGDCAHTYALYVCAHAREWDQSCASRSRIVAPGHRHGDSFFLSRRSRIFHAAREFLAKSINSRRAIY